MSIFNIICTSAPLVMIGMSAAYHAVGKAIGTENASDPDDLKQIDFSKGEAAAAFDQSKYAADKNAYLQQQMQAATARTAPQSTAAQSNLVDVRNLQYGGANVDKAAQFAGAQVGATPQGTAAQLGPADQAGQVGINREDLAFRNAQIGLQSQLQDQAAGRGPSLAAGQLKAATDRNIANQAALAASQGGRNAGTVQRGLSIGAAGANMGEAQAAAQMRIQEQQSAQSQLAGLTSAGRAADIGVNTSQAGLNQQVNLANQGANNAVQLQQGQFGQQMNLANLQNQVSNQQLQAQMLQQAGMGNQAAINSRAAQQAALLQQAGLASSAATTQSYGQNMANQQQTNLANQGASLQQSQLNDAMQRYLTEAGLGVDTRMQEAQMAKQSAIMGQNAGLNKTTAAGAEAASDRFGGFMKSAASYAAMSDEEVKHGVTSGNEKIKSYLNSFSNSADKENYSAGPAKTTSNAFGGGLGASGGMASGGGMPAGGAPSAPSKVDPSATMSGSTTVDQFGSTAAPVGVDPNAAVAMDVSDENVKNKIDQPSVPKTKGNTKMTTDNPGDRGFEAIGGAVRMDPDTGRGFKADTTTKGTLESWADKQKDKKGGEGASGGEAREGEGEEDVKEKVAAKPTPAAPRKMTDKELTDYANKMQAQTAANMSTLKEGPSVVGGPERQTKWLDDYMKGGETSDEHAKGQIHDADHKIADFLNNIHAHSYEYKPGYKDPAKGGGEGQFVSPMAQEFEKSDLGRDMVAKDEEGIRHVNYDKGHQNGTFAAALAYLNEELKKKKDK